MEFTAIPYVTVTYADGSVATIYGAKGDVRSISGVAASALDAAAITADEYNTIMGN